MDQKLMVNLGAALVPLAVGTIWYSPYVFGTVLAKANGVNFADKPKMSGGRMALAFIVTYAASYLIAARALGSIVIHQRGLFGMLADQADMHTPGTELYNTVHSLIARSGARFLTFKHGALHGSLTGLFLVSPILTIIALFEPKSVTWVVVHGLYWIVCLAIMGGIICQYMPFPA
jgi:Protein of unknown function (DUF1761)